MKVHQCGACRDVKSDDPPVSGPGCVPGRGLFFGLKSFMGAFGRAGYCPTLGRMTLAAALVR